MSHIQRPFKLALADYLPFDCLYYSNPLSIPIWAPIMYKFAFHNLGHGKNGTLLNRELRRR